MESAPTELSPRPEPCHLSAADAFLPFVRCGARRSDDRCWLPSCPRSTLPRFAKRRRACSRANRGVAHSEPDFRALLSGTSPLPPWCGLGAHGARCSLGVHDLTWTHPSLPSAGPEWVQRFRSVPTGTRVPHAALACCPSGAASSKHRLKPARTALRWGEEAPRPHNGHRTNITSAGVALHACRCFSA